MYNNDHLNLSLSLNDSIVFSLSNKLFHGNLKQNYYEQKLKSPSKQTNYYCILLLIKLLLELGFI